MTHTGLQTIARTLVADGKGLLAADETVPTITRRLAAHQIDSTPDSRRAYREMFFTTSGIAELVSGVILQDETIRQKSSAGTPFAELLTQQGIIPGIKVDSGTALLAGSPAETVTEGLDGLRGRLQEYVQLGARFAKWRGVFAVSDTRPSRRCIGANAHALARYAALCQEQDVVPIVEPEVLMDGPHTIDRCEHVTGEVLHAVFDALFEQGVKLEGILLKPNMVIAGAACEERAPVTQVAVATLRCLSRHVPAAVPGVVFLSGGQDPILATAHLNAINRLAESTPWILTFSYGRALQDEALAAWQGRPSQISAGQRAFYRRAQCNSAAALGHYEPDMEQELTGAPR